MRLLGIAAAFLVATFMFTMGSFFYEINMPVMLVICYLYAGLAGGIGVWIWRSF